jgi:hypothetical protein
MAEVIDIMPYDAKRHRRGIREVLAKNGWEDHYIAGQLAGLPVLFTQHPGRLECSKLCSPLRASDGSVPRCKSKNTKHLELPFHAVLGDGVTKVRFERGIG